MSGELEQLKQKRLQASVKNLRGQELNVNRSLQNIKKEIRETEEKREKQVKEKTQEVSTDLIYRDNELKRKEQALQNNEEMFAERSANLLSNEKKYLNLQEDIAKVRKDTLVVEIKRCETESLWQKATKLIGRANHQTALAVQKEERATKIEKENKNQLDMITAKTFNLNEATKHYDEGKKTYEMLKKELEPKLFTVNENEKLVAEREKKVSVREEEVKAQKEENTRILEYFSKQKEILDDEKAKLKEKSIDIDTKAIKAEVRI